MTYMRQETIAQQHKSDGNAKLIAAQVGERNENETRMFRHQNDMLGKMALVAQGKQWEQVLI